MSQNTLQQFIPHKQMRFAPIEDDDDELSQFIKNDPLAHDNSWDLHETIDGEKLEAFWSGAIKDLEPLEVDPEEAQ